jgi:hypothetical protein
VREGALLRKERPRPALCTDALGVGEADTPRHAAFSVSLNLAWGLSNGTFVSGTPLAIGEVERCTIYPGADPTGHAAFSQRSTSDFSARFP